MQVDNHMKAGWCLLSKRSANVKLPQRELTYATSKEICLFFNEIQANCTSSNARRYISSETPPMSKWSCAEEGRSACGFPVGDLTLLFLQAATECLREMMAITLRAPRIHSLVIASLNFVRNFRWQWVRLSTYRSRLGI